MRKLLALPFGLTFVVLLLVSLWVFSVKSFALDPQFYTSTLATEGAFTAFNNDPLQYYDWSQSFRALNALPVSMQRDVVKTIVPPGWLEQTTGSIIQQMLDWLNSNQSFPPNLTVDFRPIKDRLQGPPAQQVAGDITTQIPACAVGQSPNLSFDRLPECLPEGVDRTLVSDQIESALSSAAANMPDTIDLGTDLTGSDDQRALTSARSMMRLLGFIILALPLLALVVWLVGALIDGRDFREMLRWAGGWLLAATLISLLLGGLLLLARDSLLASAQLVPASSAPAVAGTARDLGAVVLQRFALGAMIPAGILFLFALLLIVLGRPAR